jgi:hypothetical protein
VTLPGGFQFPFSFLFIAGTAAAPTPHVRMQEMDQAGHKLNAAPRRDASIDFLKQT